MPRVYFDVRLVQLSAEECKLRIFSLSALERPKMASTVLRVSKHVSVLKKRHPGCARDVTCRLHLNKQARLRDMANCKIKMHF